MRSRKLHHGSAASRLVTWIGLVLAAALCTGSALAATSQELFRIERNTNRNAVVYSARVAAGGELDHQNPVSAFWDMLETGGPREELTWMERSVAYGYSTSRDKHGVVLRLVAFDKRALRLTKRDSRYFADVRIAGKLAHLKRIWVQADPGLLGPSVRFIELDGVDVVTGQRLTERIAR